MGMGDGLGWGGDGDGDGPRDEVTAREIHHQVKEMVLPTPTPSPSPSPSRHTSHDVPSHSFHLSFSSIHDHPCGIPELTSC